MVEETGGAFSDKEYSALYPSGIEHHFWNKARNQIIAAALKQGSNAPGGRILEIGCGTGVVVSGLRALGFDCWGSDLGMGEPVSGAEGYLYLGENCLDLDLAFRQSIKSILLLDVIEHVENPISFMASINKSFSNAHTLLVTVPARHELWSNYDERYGHLRRYNRPMLTSELDAAGFKPLKMHYFFHALYPVMRVIVSLRGSRGTEIQAPQVGNVSYIVGLPWPLVLKQK